MTRLEWPSCLADQFAGLAFFDGIRIDTDRITDPRWDRVLPILPEEQVLMCRLMHDRQVLSGRPAVLDVGTGSGVFGIWAATRGCDVLAIDNSPRAIKFAQHNSEEPGNRRAIARSGGTLRLEAQDFLRWAPQTPTKFDIVILAPPYNPTAPGVFPAGHAEAGLLGQDRFHEQLPLASRLLRKGGRIVGNQMAFHRRGQCAAWWRQQLDTLKSGRSGCYALQYCSILDPAEQCAREFLRQQYSHYLDPALRPDTAGAVDEYIDLALKATGVDGVFALYYYEIQWLEGTDQGSTILRFELPYESPAQWQDRIDLHRRIVEHTSSKHSIPTAAMFLQNDFTPPLPKAPAAALKNDPGYKVSFRSSVLQSVLTWIRQNRLLGSAASTFDLLLIDVGPWFSSPRGRDSIRNEALLCATPGWNQDAREVLLNYQRNTVAQQQSRLAPFFHPSFTGAADPSEWRGVNFHAVDGVPFGFGLDADDYERLQKWASEVDSAFQALTREPPGENTHIELLTSPFPVVAYASSSLKSLGVQQPMAYARRVERECEGIVDAHTQRRNLELLHMAFHRRLRAILRPEDQDSFSSALLGLPLSMAFSGRTLDESDLPDNYRGGVWIYAASRGTISPRQEVAMWDLARLTALTAGASISASATTSLIEAAEARASAAEGVEGKAWVRLTESVRALFSGSELHTAKDWLERRSQHTLQEDKWQSLRLACERFIKELGIDPAILQSDIALITLGRSAYRGRCIGVPFIQVLFGQEVTSGASGYIDAIRCSSKASSPGKLIAALAYFPHTLKSTVRRHPEVRTVRCFITVDSQSELEEDKRLIRVTLEATYDSEHSARTASQILAMTPGERKNWSKRESAGQACEAADRLRTEAESNIEPRHNGNVVTAAWHFEYTRFE